MCKHEDKHCPRCGAVFECKVGSILICQCTTIDLNEAESNYLAERFDDCLCVSCMEELKVEYHRSQAQGKGSGHGRSLNNMMCLDIYLASLSKEEYERIRHRVSPARRTSHPLLSWDISALHFQQRRKKLC